MSSRRQPWDPGLQPERTALAWRRTLLSLVLGAIVLALTGVREDRPVIVASAVVVVVVALVRVAGIPITGGMPSDDHLHSWPHLVKVAVLVIALGLVGACAALAGVVAAMGR